TLQVAFGTLGTRTVRAEDAAAGIQGESNVVVVSGGPAVSCALSKVPSTSAGGAGFMTHVKLLDAGGNVAASYRGTMQITASDSAARLPAAYAFTSGDAGEHEFLVRLFTQGAQTVTAQDTANGSLSCTSPVTVGAPTASKFAF